MFTFNLSKLIPDVRSFIRDACFCSMVPMLSVKVYDENFNKQIAILEMVH